MHPVSSPAHPPRDPGIRLDHIAVASRHAFDGFVVYRDRLGGTWVGGGFDPGFWWGQLRFPGGMKVELLEPARNGGDDFLFRFLDRNGPGPHHLTFKVPSIVSTLERLEAAGYHPVGVRLDNPAWKEAFLHPREAPGVVIQVAEAAGDGPEPGCGLPPPRQEADLTAVVHLVADLEAARDLFVGLLGGREAAGPPDAGGPAVDVRWPGGGRVVLVHPTEAAPRAWLGDRPGRIHHIELACPHPWVLDGAAPVDGDTWEVPPELNRGVRLRLRTVTDRGG